MKRKIGYLKTSITGALLGLIFGLVALGISYLTMPWLTGKQLKVIIPWFVVSGMIIGLFLGWSSRKNEKQETRSMSVLPKNYRRIALYAISVASEPVVLINRKPVQDFSETGPLTQSRIRKLIDFEVRDGANPILGFHDHPDEMWVTENYSDVAAYCEAQGWLKIQRHAS